MDGICPVAEALCDHRDVELKVHPPAGETDMIDIAKAVAKIVEQAPRLREGDRAPVASGAGAVPCTSPEAVVGGGHGGGQ